MNLPSVSLKQSLSIVVLGAGLLLGSQYLLRMVFPVTPITVTGQGKVSVPSEKVRFLVSVLTTSESASQSISSSEAATGNLTQIAKAESPKAEIQGSLPTTSLVATANGGRAYQTVAAFLVTSTDIEKTPKLIKAMYDQGATQVGNVTFLPSNQQASEQQALSAAVKEAKDQAQRIAKATGKHVGKMVSFASDTGDASSSVSGKGKDSQTGSFDNIEVTKAVSIVYELY